LGIDNEKESKFRFLGILELILQKLVLVIAEPWKLYRKITLTVKNSFFMTKLATSFSFCAS